MERYTSETPQTLKDKLVNFWYYHKLKVLAGFLILCALAVAVNSCVKKDSIDLYVLYMVNGAYSETEIDALSEKLKVYADDLDGDGEKRVQVITVCFSDVLARTDQTQEGTLARLVSQIASGPAVFYVFDEPNYQALKETKADVFEDIGGLCRTTPYLEKDRFNATQAGVLSDIEFYKNSEKDFYFGMRNTAGITEKDSRYTQIEQCKNVLSRIMQAYS